MQVNSGLSPGMYLLLVEGWSDSVGRYTIDVNCYDPEQYNYEAVDDQGCDDYIHMDSEYEYGIEGGSTTVEECAAAVQAYDGRDGCQADYFFYEDGGYCNCPVDACTEASENENAGGSGQLYEFTACSAVGKMKQCMPAFPPVSALP